MNQHVYHIAGAFQFRNYRFCSDHLQLIRFWPSLAPGKGVCGGAKFFGSALLQPARAVFARL